MSVCVCVCVVFSIVVCWNEQLEHSYGVTSTKVQKVFNYSAVSVSQHLGFLMCAQMIWDCTQGCSRHRKWVCAESWLQEKNPLPHQGLEPASVLCLPFTYAHRCECAQSNTHTHTRILMHTHTYTQRRRNYRVNCEYCLSTLQLPPPADKLTGDVAADLPHVVQMGEDLINAGLVFLAFLCPASKTCSLAIARSVRDSSPIQSQISIKQNENRMRQTYQHTYKHRWDKHTNTHTNITQNVNRTR